LGRFWNRAQGIIRTETPSQPSLRPIDNWLLSRLQRTIQTVTTSLEAAETRTASQAAFYDFEEDLRWYHRRTTQDRPGAQWIRQQVLSTRLRLLAPFIPFITNELHEQLTGQSAEMASWPAVDDNHINRPLEASETQIGRLVDDIQDIQQSLSNADEYIPAADPDHIEITTAPSWHRAVFESIVQEGADQAEVMSTVMQNPELRKRGNAVNDLVGELVKFARGRDEKELEALASVNEEETYRRAVTFLEREFDATINISQTTDASASAIPFRPEIDLQANQ
jgi:leucyl-tRNA synthetase